MTRFRLGHSVCLSHLLRLFNGHQFLIVSLPSFPCHTLPHHTTITTTSGRRRTTTQPNCGSIFFFLWRFVYLRVQSWCATVQCLRHGSLGRQMPTWHTWRTCPARHGTQTAVTTTRHSKGSLTSRGVYLSYVFLQLQAMAHVAYTPCVARVNLCTHRRLFETDAAAPASSPSPHTACERSDCDASVSCAHLPFESSWSSTSFTSSTSSFFAAVVDF